MLQSELERLAIEREVGEEQGVIFRLALEGGSEGISGVLEGVGDPPAVLIRVPNDLRPVGGRRG